jgi:hypothetical protein
MRTFEDVFAAFGGPARFAREIGIPVGHAQTMRQRGSIPAAYFLRTAIAARRLKIKGVTVATLAALAAARARQNRGAA